MEYSKIVSLEEFVSVAQLHAGLIRSKTFTVIPDALIVDGQIPIFARLSARCLLWHTWEDTALNLKHGCKICRILNQLHRTDSLIISLQRHYSQGQVLFDFRCSANHRFTVKYPTRRTQCQSCHLLDYLAGQGLAGIRLDCKIKNKDDNTLLRFYCMTGAHNKDCSNEQCLKLINTKNPVIKYSSESNSLCICAILLFKCNVSQLGCLYYWRLRNNFSNYL